MEIVKKIVIKSGQAKHLLDMKMKNGGSFVVAALTAIGVAYRLADQECLYPCVSLLGLCDEIHKTQTAMERFIVNFEKLLLDFKTDASAIESSSECVYKMRIGNSIVGEMVYLLELYDRLSLLISAANHLKLFRTERYQFYVASGKNLKRIVKVYRTALALCHKEKKIRQVSISHYLKNDEAYQTFKDELGIVRPAVLFSALNLFIFPSVTASRRETIFAELRKMK